MIINFCKTKIFGSALLIFKHADDGHFIDMTKEDYENVCRKFKNSNDLESFMNKYDFLPYSTTKQNYYDVNIREVLEQVVEVKARNYKDA